ncbi:hypothetical protein [Brevibacterium album]|uniref:hypothetical protein n=1 Tax=Brevibacterium album TaxID=417948 RepID=UPI0004902762|nr:hypothetical protein [Brevibacterium album]
MKKVKILAPLLGLALLAGCAMEPTTPESVGIQQDKAPSASPTATKSPTPTPESEPVAFRDFATYTCSSDGEVSDIREYESLEDAWLARDAVEGQICGAEISDSSMREYLASDARAEDRKAVRLIEEFFSSSGLTEVIEESPDFAMTEEALLKTAHGPCAQFRVEDSFDSQGPNARLFIEAAYTVCPDHPLRP